MFVLSCLCDSQCPDFQTSKRQVFKVQVFSATTFNSKHCWACKCKVFFCASMGTFFSCKKSEIKEYANGRNWSFKAADSVKNLRNKASDRMWGTKASTRVLFRHMVYSSQVLKYFEAFRIPKKHCAIGCPLKTRYSGHQNSRLRRRASKHTQTNGLASHMKGSWKRKK